MEELTWIPINGTNWNMRLFNQIKCRYAWAYIFAKFMLCAGGGIPRQKTSDFVLAQWHVSCILGNDYTPRRCCFNLAPKYKSSLQVHTRLGLDSYRYIVPLDLKGCICHFTKWQTHPFISKGRTYGKLKTANVSIKVGGSLRFAGNSCMPHPHAQYGQCSKVWGPSEVNIMNQRIETTDLL